MADNFTHAKCMRLAIVLAAQARKRGDQMKLPAKLRPVALYSGLVKSLQEDAGMPARAVARFLRSQAAIIEAAHGPAMSDEEYETYAGEQG